MRSVRMDLLKVLLSRVWNPPFFLVHVKMDHKVVGTYASNYASLNHPTHYSDNSISSLSRKISSCYIVDFTTKASTVTCIDSFDPWEYTKKNMWLPHLHPFILPFYDNIFCTQPINKSRNSKATTLPWYESKCAPEWFYGQIVGTELVSITPLMR